MLLSNSSQESYSLVVLVLKPGIASHTFTMIVTILVAVINTTVM